MHQAALPAECGNPARRRRRQARCLLGCRSRVCPTLPSATASDAASAAVQQQERRLAAAAGGAGKAAKRPPRTTSQGVYTPPAGAGAAGAAAPLTAEELAARERNNWLMAGTMLALSGYGYYVTVWQRPSASGAPPPQDAQLVNWSATHEVATRRLYQPETLAELEAVVSAAHKSGARSRCGVLGARWHAVLRFTPAAAPAPAWPTHRLLPCPPLPTPQAASCGVWAAGCRPMA